MKATTLCNKSPKYIDYRAVTKALDWTSDSVATELVPDAKSKKLKQSAL
jgi:hypothetical protein